MNRRYPTIQEYDLMPWPARHNLARRIGINPRRLRGWLQDRQISAYLDRVEAARRAAPPQPNPETAISICPSCGFPKHKDTSCHNCRRFASRHEQSATT